MLQLKVMQEDLKKIAITGNMGTGKSAVGQFLRQAGEAVLETDKITVQLYENRDVRGLIQDKFGLGFFCDDGSVDRRKFAEQIFASDADRAWLERLFWPRIKDEVDLWFYKQKCRQKRRAFVIVPLLFEAGWEKFFDEIWLVRSSREDILTRLQIQRRLTLAQARKRLSTQMSDQQKIDLVNLVIRNNGSLDDLKSVIQQLL
ncbi:MAG: dephospho-CoA kinase [bacterium]|nr:dephospho-CoA kinase [bacterium]